MAKRERERENPPVRNLMRNRTFCEGDNLEYLLRMPDASVDLIATDPPFNKNREFQGIGKAEGAKFKDYWAWDDDEDVHPAYLAHVRQHWPALNEVIEAAYAAHSPGMAAFLAFMSVRLIEMHRILKPTGSLYLHSDPTANAYLRLMLDSIFGRDNFRNEITWQRTTAHSDARRFGANTDTILFYARSDTYTFNPQHIPYEDGYKTRFKHADPDGRKWTDDNLTAKGLSGGGYEYTYKKKRELWRVPLATMERLDAEGRLHFTTKGGIRIKRYLDELPGRPLQALWTDLPAINSQAVERRHGWPTQKPLALYRRIIEASSNKGDLVLDPFAGCATTCVAAEQLGRHWVGIDLSPKARGITMDRLENEAGKGTLWEQKVRILTVEDLRPLPKGKAAALAVRQLPERQERSVPRGFNARDVRPFLAVREAAGTQRARRGESNMACQGCGFSPPFIDYVQVDHIIPQAKQGPDDSDNLCLLCGPCNQRKSHRLNIEELRESNRDDDRMQDESALMPMDAASIRKRRGTMMPEDRRRKRR